MRRAERLFRLVNEMRTRDVSRAEDLAAYFEVSISTIYRDIAHLQGSGLPIEGEAGIGYILRPGFDLPNVTFTQDQLDALAMGLAFVESTADPELASAAREARAKIQASLPEPQERRLADAPYLSVQAREKATPEVAVVRGAIRTNNVLVFDYTDKHGVPSQRQVRPLVLWNMTEGWMFSAWCEMREDFRTFRFDRLQDLRVSEGRFSDDEATGMRTFLEMVRKDARDQ